MAKRLQISKDQQRVQQYQPVAWLLGLVACLLSIIAWGDSLSWQLTPLSAYLVFPLLGLLAYGLMWSSYVIGTLRDLFGLPDAHFTTYLKVVGWAVLALICLHPGLLIYQRFQDGFGLPPGSYESYVAPGLGWVTLLGTASLLIFLAYELYRFFGDRSWWHYVQTAGDLAMLAIFYHGLRLGTQINSGWFRWVWWFYGITLVAILARSYFLKYRHRKAKAHQNQ